MARPEEEAEPEVGAELPVEAVVVVVTVPPYPVDACHFLYQLSEVPELEGDVLVAEVEVEGVAAELPVGAA